MNWFSVLIPLGAVTLLGACEREHQPEPRLVPAQAYTPPDTTTTVGREGTVHERSLRAISQYRCDAQIRCGTLDDYTVEARDACADSYVERGYADLAPENCGSIDQERLSVCLALIRAAECGTTQHDLSAIPECGHGQLCAS